MLYNHPLLLFRPGKPTNMQGRSQNLHYLYLGMGALKNLIPYRAQWSIAVHGILNNSTRGVSAHGILKNSTSGVFCAPGALKTLFPIRYSGVLLPTGSSKTPLAEFQGTESSKTRLAVA